MAIVYAVIMTRRAQCRGRVGEAFCASRWFHVRSISRRRQHAPNRSAWIRSGSL